MTFPMGAPTHVHNIEDTVKADPPDVSLPVKPGGGERFSEILEEVEIEMNGMVNGEKKGISPVNLKVTSPLNVSDHLDGEAEESLTFQINDLYQKLQPSPDSYEIRHQFLAKIQRILDLEWPGKEIRAYLFGSTVNGLGTSGSDVDICLKTPWDDRVAGVSNMHVLAKGLGKHGMQKIYTVAKAKVPICKFYDPEYGVNCDINVNNTQALRNTTLIKTYVEIDPRVRPLLMVIKHWTKRRVLNDAAKGGTLSSYCWVMMVLNFLQMRNPPILPCLHEMYFERLRSHPEEVTPVVIDGIDCSFHDDINTVRGYGARNLETLGALFYAFFHRYSVEFNYEDSVVSVRHGRYLTKTEKGWNVDVERMCRFLCVEEPFNPQRNLANSADGVSVAGLRKEFNRALTLLADQADLDEVCEQYYFPPNHHRIGYGGYGAGPRLVNGVKRGDGYGGGWNGPQRYGNGDAYGQYNHNGLRPGYGYGGFQGNMGSGFYNGYFNGFRQNPVERKMGNGAGGDFGERGGIPLPSQTVIGRNSFLGEEERRRDVWERHGSRSRSISSDGLRPRSNAAERSGVDPRKRPALPSLFTARLRNSPERAVGPRTAGPSQPNGGQTNGVRTNGMAALPGSPPVSSAPLKQEEPYPEPLSAVEQIQSPSPPSPLEVMIQKRTAGPDETVRFKIPATPRPTGARAAEGHGPAGMAAARRPSPNLPNSRKPSQQPSPPSPPPPPPQQSQQQQQKQHQRQQQQEEKVNNDSPIGTKSEPNTRPHSRAEQQKPTTNKQEETRRVTPPTLESLPKANPPTESKWTQTSPALELSEAQIKRSSIASVSSASTASTEGRHMDDTTSSTPESGHSNPKHHRGRRNSKGVMVWANHSHRHQATSTGGGGIRKPIMDGLFERPGGSSTAGSDHAGEMEDDRASVSSDGGKRRGRDATKGKEGSETKRGDRPRSLSVNPPVKVAWQGMGMRGPSAKNVANGGPLLGAPAPALSTAGPTSSNSAENENAGRSRPEEEQTEAGRKGTGGNGKGGNGGGGRQGNGRGGGKGRGKGKHHGGNSGEGR
ncbi:hypothetical protein HK104_001356 [Borealophlyctis nickersoniae]|nr:hypothetical protein HK104_001356 [Borealophlyctis nickersoniae]